MCTSPKSYAGLADGDHTFSVRYVPPPGGGDPPPPGPESQRTWKVDTVAPTARIDAAPTGVVNANEADVAFSSSEPEGAGFECRLDGGAAYACSSPQRLLALGAGAHVFAVKAFDAAGNGSPEVQTSWSVDPAAVPPPGSAAAPQPPGPGPIPVSTSACAADVREFKAGPIVAKPLTGCFLKGLTVGNKPILYLVTPARVNGILIRPRGGKLAFAQERHELEHLCERTGEHRVRFDRDPDEGARLDSGHPADRHGGGACSGTLEQPGGAGGRVQHQGRASEGRPEVRALDAERRADEGQHRPRATGHLQSPAGGRRWTGPNSTANSVEGLGLEFVFSASNDIGVTFSTKLQIQELWVGPVRAKDLSVAYDHVLGTFDGSVTLRLGPPPAPGQPPSGGELRLALQLGPPPSFFAGVRKLGAEISGVDIPVFHPALRLSKLGGEFGFNVANDLEMSANATFGAGAKHNVPGVFKGHTLSVDGSLKMALSVPPTLAISGLGKLFDLELLDAGLKYTGPELLEVTSGRLGLLIAGYGFAIALDPAKTWIDAAAHNVEGDGRDQRRRRSSQRQGAVHPLIQGLRGLLRAARQALRVQEACRR